MAKSDNKVVKIKTDKTKKVVKQNTEDQGNLAGQPVFDENGVIVEQNIFPPLDDDATFEGTGAGQRQLRAQKEAQEENDDK